MAHFQLTHEQRVYQQYYTYRFGMLFAGFVAFFWSGFLAQYFQDGAAVALPITSSTISILLLMVAVYYFVRGPKLPKQELKHFNSGMFWAKFWVVIALECIVIWAVLALCNANGYPEALWPVIAIVVALHWAPLSKLNGSRVWYPVAIIVPSCVLLTMLLMPHTATITVSGQSANTWGLVAIGAMILGLWYTAVLCLRGYLALVRQSR